MALARRLCDLAQVNISRLRQPIDSPALADFVAALDAVNAEAEAAPGFIWRLCEEDGDSTSIRAFEWDNNGSAGVLVNLSTWESSSALRDYIYSGLHRQVLARRREWFQHVAEATTALWWIPTGHRPSIKDAEAAIRFLRTLGPTELAFHLNDDWPMPTTVS